MITGDYFLLQTFDYVSDEYLLLTSYLEFEEIKLEVVFLLLLPGIGVPDKAECKQPGAVGGAAVSPGGGG